MSMGRQKTNSEFQRQVQQQVGSEYTFLETYQGARTKLRVRHNKCGFVYKVTPDGFLNKQNRCPQCFGHRRYTTKSFQEKLDQLYGHEYRVLSKYQDEHSKIKIEHLKCGYLYEVRPNDIISGKRCPRCYATPKKTQAQFEHEVQKQVGKEYTVLGSYQGTDTKLLMKHNSCGNTWLITPNKFLHGRRCPYCNASHGEKKIKKVLADLHIAYQAQKRFDGCHYKRTLPFDFYLPDYRMCIEYDGIQHYIPQKHFGGIVNYYERKKRDQIKDQFCQVNHIRLLRIPYTVKTIKEIRALILPFLERNENYSKV